MSGTIAPTSPTAAYVDITGIHAPTYQDITTYLTQQFQSIYGSDIVTDSSSQDGQLIGILALAIADTNSACIAVYNSFSPSTGQGVGLSSMVKINGMTRALPSNSSVDLYLVGQTGQQIINGQAADISSNLWNLPATVTFPVSGDITVTAIAATAGAITALPGDITRIATPTLGWQSVTNPSAAAPGAPVETDALLRLRQSTSTALPSLSILEGIVGAVLALPGVIACKGYENDTSIDYSAAPITTTTTALAALGATVIPVASVTGMTNGMTISSVNNSIPPGATISSIAALNITISAATTISTPSGTSITVGVPPIGVAPLPPHSISMAVEGGDAVQICQTILTKKSAGCYTYGTTRETVNDVYGLPHNIGFFVPVPVAIGVKISLHALAGYSSVIGLSVSQSVADYINGLGSGVPVTYSKLWVPADLSDTGQSITYDIYAMTIATPVSGTYGTANIPISIFQIAACDPANVVITVG